MKVGISNLEGIKKRNRKQESKKKVEMRKAGEERALRKITVKIELERINTQKKITVEALLDSGAMGLVMSSEFARKQRFRLKKIEWPIYVRNVDGLFNKERPQ